jgi:hypothetical protein
MLTCLAFEHRIASKGFCSPEMQPQVDRIKDEARFEIVILEIEETKPVN